MTKEGYPGKCRIILLGMLTFFQTAVRGDIGCSAFAVFTLEGIFVVRDSYVVKSHINTGETWLALEITGIFYMICANVPDSNVLKQGQCFAIIAVKLID